jgi:hypothetical protein
MVKIAESFLKKYGVWEYVLFLAGIIIVSRTVYSIVIANFKTTTWTEIGVIVFLFSLGVLAVSVPKTLVDLAKKKTGANIDNNKNCDH